LGACSIPTLSFSAHEYEHEECNVNDLQKLGGVGAWLMSGLFGLILVLFLLILPHQGLTDESNAAQVLMLARTSPTIYLALAVGIIAGGAAILLVPALYERLRAATPRLALLSAIVGGVAIVLLIANGGIYLFGVLRLAGLSRHNPAAATSAYLALRVVASALGDAGFVAYGSWSLLACRAALEGARLPRLVAHGGLVWGALAILASFISDLELLAGLMGIVWFLGLGLALWREPSGQ
jgi:hypothetical protein